MQILEDLPLETYTFELRFDHAFLLWDKAGLVWSEMIAFNHSLKLQGVQPNVQTFETDSLRLSLDLQALRVSARGEDAIEEVTGTAEKLLAVASETINLDSFKRAGFRTIRTKEFDSAAEALEFGGFTQDDNKGVLGEKSRKVGFFNSVRYETDKNGLLSTLKVEEREVGFTAPWESRTRIKLDPTVKLWILQADADYYTIGNIARESFDVETWIRQASKTTRREWSS
jgi:hypothetical protein